MLTNHQRKDLMIEAEFLPGSIEEAAEVRARILATIKAGDVEDVTPRFAESMADEITGWLIGKVQGVDAKAATTRSKYRRILAAVDAGPGSPRNRQAGLATVTSIGAAGGLALAGTAAAAGSPASAAAGVVIVAVSAAWAARHNLENRGIYVM